MILRAGNGEEQEAVGVGGCSGWVQRGIPLPLGLSGEEREMSPSLSAEGKGTWLSLLLPHPVHGRGRVLVPSLLSRAQKLFPVEPLEEVLPNS